ncbi:hypothetical protein AAIE21_11320 [Paenibacillus sp. 102]|uniref:hypothetical protein n=1 Tax=Paenibacillus sp. 102 TaxID=3120823 RepID=UPI0031BAA7D0
MKLWVVVKVGMKKNILSVAIQKDILHVGMIMMMTAGKNLRSAKRIKMKNAIVVAQQV